MADAHLSFVQEAEPDCFETPDGPVNHGFFVEEEASTGEVSRVPINSMEAFAHFQDKSLEVDGADFSGSIAHRKGRGKPLASEPQRPESFVARYQRLGKETAALRAEIDALRAQGNSCPLSSDDLAELSAQANQLCQQMDSIRLPLPLRPGSSRQTIMLLQEALNEPEKKHSIASSRAAEDKIEPSELLQAAQQANSVKLTELESRAHSLETAFGHGLESTLKRAANEVKADRGLATVSGVLSTMQSQLSLLDERTMDMLSTRLKQFIQQGKELEADMKKGNDGVASDFETKVAALYEALTQQDTDGLLPEVLARLRALHTVHQQMENFTATMQQLQTTQDEISALLVSQGSNVNELQCIIKENSAAIAANLSQLAQRLESLKV